MRGGSFDVAIVGGGPAGCAMAISLRAHAPQLSVVLIEASGYERLRIGETIPPPGRGLLEHLDVWDAFADEGHREVYGTRALWGSAHHFENDFLFAAQGAGWHLDRSKFDAMLALQAHREGVTVLLRTRLESAEMEGDTWRLRTSGERNLSARYVVDGTGARAAVARRRGARFVTTDRMVSFGCIFEESCQTDARSLVEAFSEGWWYTAGLPGGMRIVMCFTDRIEARRLRLSDPDRWFGALAMTMHVGKSVRAASPRGPLIVRAVESRRLEPVASLDWLAVGDAASLFDPLSSQGIVKALRSGIFASYAVGDFLGRGDQRGISRYCRFIRDEFDGYCKARSHYYQAEQRWPESEFWRQRAAGSLTM